MSIFDNILGNWIQVVDNKNNITVENYGFDTGVIKGTTENHCVKCVAVNQCYFKNEEDKKPKPFDITKINIRDSILNELFPGLYHFSCHCKEKPINLSIDDIKLIIPDGKIKWLFIDKPEWIKSMGYELNEDFIIILKEKIRQSYFYGMYSIQTHTHFGVKIKLNIDLPGYKNKEEKLYKLTSGFMVFPNGKIKCNTLIGGWQK